MRVDVADLPVPRGSHESIRPDRAVNLPKYKLSIGGKSIPIE